MTPDNPASATLAGIRKDIEGTASIYDLDGPGKNSYPVSAAMIRHARALLAAIDALTAALARHQQWFKNEHGARICGGCLEPAPCPDTDVIGRALAGKDSSDE